MTRRSALTVTADDLKADRGGIYAGANKFTLGEPVYDTVTERRGTISKVEGNEITIRWSVPVENKAEMETCEEFLGEYADRGGDTVAVSDKTDTFHRGEFGRFIVTGGQEE